MRALFILTFLSLFSVSAYAGDPVTVSSLLENVCIASNLTAPNIKQMASSYASANDFEVKDITEESLSTLSDTTKAAWGVRRVNEAAFIISYTETPADSGVSHGCVVSTTGDDYISVKNFIESRYQVEHTFETVQGSFKVLFYKVALAGKAKSKGIGIQVTDPTMTSMKMLAVSYFEPPDDL